MATYNTEAYTRVGTSINRVNIGAHWNQLQGKPSNFPPTSHNHDASNINTGTLHTDRIPAIPVSKIPTLDLHSKLYKPNYLQGDFPQVLKPLIDVLRADRSAFLPASQIIIEKSIDAGTTWSDAGFSNSDKIKLFTGQRPNINIPLKNGVKSTDCMIRITITAMTYNQSSATGETDRYNYWNSNYVLSTERYCSIDDGWVWLNSNSDKIYCKVETASGAASTSWSQIREAYLIGWTGGNYISLGGSSFGGGTSQTTNRWNWRFTFRTCSPTYTFNDSDLANTYTTSAQYIQHIKLTGMNVWTYPSSNPYMYHDHMYSWDENKVVNFPADVK